MYFRKLFTGSKPNESSKSSVIRLGTTGYINHYSIYTNIINNALLDTLAAAGVEASYDASRIVLTILGIKVQVLSMGSFASGFWEVYDQSGGVRVESSNNTVGGTTAYNFAVTLMGEPEGILNICIGTNVLPTDTTQGICLAQILDLSTNARVKGVCRAYSNYFTLFDELGTKKIYVDYFSRTFQGGAADTVLPLQDSISGAGLYKMENSYVTNDAVVLAKSFYNIEGALYFAPYNGCLTKCITE